MAVINRGKSIGKDNTAKSAPLTCARDMTAAMIVVDATNPRLPRRSTNKKSHKLKMDKFIQIMNKGTITISKRRRRTKLNRSFPKNTVVGVATSFNILTVLLSSSLTKTCAKPDMEEKNITSQKRDEIIRGFKEKTPREKLATVKVVSANMRMAFKA